MGLSSLSVNGLRANGSGTLDAVGSRVELKRLLEDLHFAKTGSFDRLRELEAEVQATPQLGMLNQARKRIHDNATSANAASILLRSASGNSDAIKTKIDDVLVLYDRCKDAREIVDQVILLRDALQGCHGAIEREDWERAAFLAKRARDIPEYIVLGKFADRMVPSAEYPDRPIDTLKAACNDLAKRFLREFDSATKSQQMDRASLFFKLFPLVGHKEEGLNAYAIFICQTVTGMARNVLHSSNQLSKKSSTFYGAVLTKLFENLAVIFEQHSRIIERHYGKTAMSISVMPLVQQEVDRQAGLIIDTFWDERRVENLINNVKSYDYPVLISILTQNASSREYGNPSNNGTSVNIDEDLEDLKVASARLSELEAMLSRWKLYSSYVLQTEPPESSLRIAIQNSKTAGKMDDLLSPTFAALALFVLRRSIERASMLDELPTKQQINSHPEFSAESPLVSSMVDDIIFVFNQVLLQIVETGHKRTIEMSLSNLRRVLESDLIGILRRKLQESAPADIPPSGEFGGAGAFMIYLNNLEFCDQYIGEAVMRCQEKVSEDLRPQLSLLSSAFKKLASELVLDGCQNLATKRIASHARSLVSTHFKTAAYTSNDSMRCGGSFVLGWRQMLRPFRQLMHPNVVARLLDIVCRNISQSFEKFVWSLQLKLTSTGCLDLDRDLNQVISAVSEVNYGLRHRFVKVAQMVSLLVDESEDLTSLSKDEQTRLVQMRKSIIHV